MSSDVAGCAQHSLCPEQYSRGGEEPTYIFVERRRERNVLGSAIYISCIRRRHVDLFTIHPVLACSSIIPAAMQWRIFIQLIFPPQSHTKRHERCSKIHGMGSWRYSHTPAADDILSCPSEDARSHIPRSSWHLPQANRFSCRYGIVPHHARGQGIGSRTRACVWFLHCATTTQTLDDQRDAGGILAPLFYLVEGVRWSSDRCSQKPFESEQVSVVHITSGDGWTRQKRSYTSPGCARQRVRAYLGLSPSKKVTANMSCPSRVVLRCLTRRRGCSCSRCSSVLFVE